MSRIRAVLCGLLNDGLFRGAPEAQGSEARPDGQLAAVQHAQTAADAHPPARAAAANHGVRVREVTRAEPSTARSAIASSLLEAPSGNSLVAVRAARNG